MPRAAHPRARAGRPGGAPSIALAAALFAGLLLAACGGQRLLPAEAPAPPEACDTLYVAAPGNYIIDLAAGADVVLDPAAHVFPLFCAPETAARAAAAAVDAGRLPPGDWRVYRLDGAFADLVQPAEPGAASPYALARQARLADWVEPAAPPVTARAPASEETP